jgi:hypothetical protein
MTTTPSFGMRKKVRKGADMKNLTPSGYQGFPSLFNGLFGGVALLFRKLVGRQSPEGPAGQSPRQESGELRPIQSSFDEPVSKKTGGEESH